ncbi:unnamed protein product [Ambrosiozyma monospora]|uniref:Unnamed protein product n=1 Tax=Ambrosiozyma monospora TaxID=43982 RepID=A0A9W6Z2Y4_AMBMO|nr:unnamed protein product [Ambrosiozyma monospora]
MTVSRNTDTTNKNKDNSSTPVASPSPSSPPQPPPSDKIYKQAGALGVYSHYLLQNNPNNSVKLRSPLRSSSYSPNISESTIKQLRFNSNTPTPTPTPTKIKSTSTHPHPSINMPSLIPVQPTPSQPSSPEVTTNRAKTPLSSTSGFTTSSSTVLNEKAQLRFRPAENEKEKESHTQRIVVKSGNVSEKSSSLVNSNASNFKLPKNLDVTFNTIKLLGGKDKLGKVVQYTLKILFIYSSKLRNTNYLSNHTSEDFIKALSTIATSAADSPSTTATSKQQQQPSNLINLLLKVLNNPKSFSVFLLSQFESRFAGLVSYLSVYRQMLRAGTIPFRLMNLLKKLQSSASVLTNSKLTMPAKSQLLKKQWWNIGTLDFAASLYYAWFDESLLMFKFGVLDKVNFANYYQKSVFHESFSWYLCILIELKQKVDKLRIVKAKEQSVLLGHEVKHKAKKLAARLKSSEAQAGSIETTVELDVPDRNNDVIANVQNSNNSENASDVDNDEELIKLQNLKKEVLLDIIKLLCDFSYDTVTVFKLEKWCPEQLQLAFGLGAGVLSFYKVWDAEKQDMICRLNQKNK